MSQSPVGNPGGASGLGAPSGLVAPGSPGGASGIGAPSGLVAPGSPRAFSVSVVVDPPTQLHAFAVSVVRLGAPSTLGAAGSSGARSELAAPSGLSAFGAAAGHRNYWPRALLALPVLAAAPTLAAPESPERGTKRRAIDEIDRAMIAMQEAKDLVISSYDAETKKARDVENRAAGAPLDGDWHEDAIRAVHAAGCNSQAAIRILADLLE